MTSSQATYLLASLDEVNRGKFGYTEAELDISEGLSAD